MADSQSVAMRRNIGCSETRGRVRLTIGPRTLACVLLFGIVGESFVDGRLALAQDDWDAGKEPINPPAAVQFQLPDFDHWVFRGKKRAQIKQMFMARAAVQIDSFALNYDLSDAQRKKLELAARGDVRRFLRKADEIRKTYELAKHDQRKLNEIMHAIQPIQKEIQAGTIFNDDSLLRKTLKNTLTGEQSDKYEQQQVQRRRFTYEAKIEYALVALESGVPLREQQCKQFVKLLLEETEPPKSFGRQPQYEVFFMASTIDEEKLKPIFDDAQWQAIKRLLIQAHAMDSNLKRNGFFP